MNLLYLMEKIKVECACGNLKLIGKYYFSHYYKNKSFVCGSCRQKGTNNSFYGKTHSEELKNRLSTERRISNLGKNNPFYGRTHSEETKKILSDKNKENQKGILNPFYGKKHTVESRLRMSESQKNYYKNHPEAREAQRIRILKRIGQNKYCITKIEKIIRSKLELLGVNFKYNFILDGRFQYDFLIYPNIILEVQGDYWHGNPKIYGKNKRPLNERQLFKIKRDKLKKKYSVEKGYKIFYIWESDINKGIFEEMDLCLQNLN